MTTNTNTTMTTMTTTTASPAPQFVLVGRDSNWLTAFAVEERVAPLVVKALNAMDGHNGEPSPDEWVELSVPLSAEEIAPTLEGWRDAGIR